MNKVTTTYQPTAYGLTTHDVSLAEHVMNVRSLMEIQLGRVKCPEDAEVPFDVIIGHVITSTVDEMSYMLREFTSGTNYETVDMDLRLPADYLNIPIQTFCTYCKIVEKSAKAPAGTVARVVDRFLMEYTEDYAAWSPRYQFHNILLGGALVDMNGRGSIPLSFVRRFATMEMSIRTEVYGDGSNSDKSRRVEQDAKFVGHMRELMFQINSEFGTTRVQQ